MKKIIFSTIVATIMLVFSSCNDEFLERYPLDSLTNETFWKSENDMKAYTAGLYTYFDGETVWDDAQSDNQASVVYNTVAAGLHTISTGTWDWSFLRKCNFFLENYNNSGELSVEITDPYKGEVLFFRAMSTYDRIKQYGDIPFTTRVLTNNDDDVLYGPRVERDIVMDQIFSDLDEAVALIPESRADEGRITRWTALALKARICLHEGTFRRYHKLDDDLKYIDAAADAAKQIIDGGEFDIYTTGDVDSDYRNLFIQLSLEGNSESILHKTYLYGEKGHDFIRYMIDSEDGMAKDFVKDYLCIDGKPTSLSTLYKGDDTLDEEFDSRDPRMAQTIVPPGRGFFAETSDDEIVPRLKQAIGAGSASATGYHIIKFFSNDEVAKYSDAETDMFLFRYAETLLIYAEAMAEKGAISQTIIDQTINKLRARAGVSDMVIADLVRDPDSDMTSDAALLDEEVSTVLEEIRRERRIELACEGFRYDDLMRWRAGKFLTKPVLGAKWSAFKDIATDDNVAVYGDVVVGEDIYVDSDGNIDLYQQQLLEGRVFDPNKHYYFSIPLGEIALNPNLEQNPGW